MSTSSGLQEGVGDGSGVEVSVAVGVSVFVAVGTRVGVLVGGGVGVGVGDGESEPHEVMQRPIIIARGRVDLYLSMIDYLPSRFLLNHRGIVSADYQQPYPIVSSIDEVLDKSQRMCIPSRGALPAIAR